MATITPKLIAGKIIGTPGGSTFTTFQVATGPALGGYINFLILRARLHIINNVGSEWLDLTPSDPFVWEYWRDHGGSMNMAYMAHHFFEVPGSVQLPIASGYTMTTGTTYDVENLAPLAPGVTVDAIYLEMVMFG